MGQTAAETGPRALSSCPVSHGMNLMQRNLLSSVFSLETSRGRGHTSASSFDRKVLARGSKLYSKLFPSSENSEVSCSVLGFPCQGKLCDAKGKQYGAVLFKGMMLPAAVSEPFSTRSRTKSAWGRGEGGENDNWLPAIYRFFLKHCFHLFQFFYQRKWRAAQNISLANGTSLSPLKKLFDPKTK